MEEMVPRFQLLGKFAGGVNRGIDLTTQLFLCALEGSREHGERDVADDHDVDVARSDFRALGKRAIHECGRDSISVGC